MDWSNCRNPLVLANSASKEKVWGTFLIEIVYN